MEPFQDPLQSLEPQILFSPFWTITSNIYTFWYIDPRRQEKTLDERR